MHGDIGKTEISGSLGFTGQLAYLNVWVPGQWKIMSVHTLMNTHSHSSTHMHAHMFMHTCTYTHTHMLMHTHTYTHVHTHSCNVCMHAHTNMHTHTHACTHTHQSLLSLYVPSLGWPSQLLVNSDIERAILWGWKKLGAKKTRISNQQPRDTGTSTASWASVSSFVSCGYWRQWRKVCDRHCQILPNIRCQKSKPWSKLSNVLT